jgi:hypothetical protein
VSTFVAGLCAVVSGHSYLLTTEPAFTLVWKHSVEKIQWEEDWQVRDQHLYLTATRVRGSGAGMDPPENSVYKGSYWEYKPQLPPQPQLRLTHSQFTEGYSFCIDNKCQLLTDKMPLTADDNLIIVAPCATAPTS